MIQALKAYGDNRIELVQEADPNYGLNEVLIKPLAVGICGTDLDIIESKIDPAFVHYPVTLGHEWCGIVVNRGAEVSRIEIGDRVVIEGIIPCEKCAECIVGNTNRCKIYDEYGFTRDGAASSAVVANERLVHRVGPKTSNESGALVEPAAVVETGLMKINPRPDSKILVIGDGTIGLIAARLGRSWLPSKVDLFGLRAAQAPLAAKAGVDGFFCDASGEEFYDVVIEASGSPTGVEMALKKVTRGGKVLILGLIGHQKSIPLMVDDLVNGDYSIVGSFGYTSEAWAKTVALLNSGELDLTFLVTHSYPLADWRKGFEALLTAPAPRGKVMLIP